MEPSAATAVSPFLRIPDATSTNPCPSIIHLKRDHNVALTLAAPSSDKPHPTLQTRFGEFAHSSLLSIPYGSQVRATTRNASNARKRKRATKDTAAEASEPVGSGDAASGFVHVLAPTAELWTNSLPHRTQVVYTPDSSYVLHRLGVKAGSVIIEAGAGSGSFTHAAVRAVYDGDAGRGRVWSFEFHEERAGKLRTELEDHGLGALVKVTHKDVCKDGFLVPAEQEEEEMKSPGATAVFLDLPAPWLALPHLSRNPKAPKSGALTPGTLAAASADPTATVTATIPLQSLLDPTSSETPELTLNNPAVSTPSTTTDDAPLLSPLSPNHTVRICCFSPCIEQVTRTVAALRHHGWVDITMEEVLHTRLEVRRQAEKGYDDGAGPRSVAEALARLRAVNSFRDSRRDIQIANTTGAGKNDGDGDGEGEGQGQGKRSMTGTKKADRGGKKLRGPDEGRLVTRTEQEVKSHTSYLTFATLPRAWSAEDEERAAREVAERVSAGKQTGVVVGGKEKRWKGEEKESRRQVRKRERAERKKREAGEGGEGDEGEEMDAEGDEEGEDEAEGDAMDVDANDQ
ncbi:tRNA methyltransferase complex GCD14 subunit-domain-containing protein [Geopyxis carbonaria]|nr:tRNA methyltransferase complex GCD14 subunit-domain-containing protein [Geopyxis carbonaria]